ncbi:MAG: repeat-containing protein [Rhodocyclales bacterium]|nr:repeat-containing protein [Rhodocyclales bacterium]
MTQQSANRPAAEALFHQSNAQLAAGELAAAEECLQQALALQNDFAEAHANLAWLLEQRGDQVGAEQAYRQAIALDAQPQMHINLGALLADQLRSDEAETHYRSALSLDPSNPAAWSNLGALLACQRRDDEAEECYRLALAYDPDHRSAHFNLSYLLLRAGRFEEGWQHFEKRDWYAQLAQHIDCPQWQGKPLTGKSVLIGIEAGQGDMIQFCRYAQLLKARGAGHISLLCHPALQRLLEGAAGVDAALPIDQPLPVGEWDVWTPLLSIPYHCQTRIDSIPDTLPYLHADETDIAYWAQRMKTLAGEATLRVGLAWRGNPRFENDAQRSLPSVATLQSLGDVTGVTFFSLQKGAGEDEATSPPAGLTLHDLAPFLHDFADTAAVVMNLDLVICVDTALAHLAGALGKPCWILLPDYKTDWRWLEQRSDSPWYPHVIRLFRQSAARDWSEVVRSLRHALANHVAAVHDGDSRNAP